MATATPASRFRTALISCVKRDAPAPRNARNRYSPRLSRTGERGASPSRIDLHRASHAGRQDHAFRHLIDMDAHRDALGQPHPGEDRIDVGQALAVGLGIRDADATRDAADMTPDGL